MKSTNSIGFINTRSFSVFKEKIGIHTPLKFLRPGIIKINGVKIEIKTGDSLRKIVEKINTKKHITGIEAKLEKYEGGYKLVLQSRNQEVKIVDNYGVLLSLYKQKMLGIVIKHINIISPKPFTTLSLIDGPARLVLASRAPLLVHRPRLPNQDEQQVPAPDASSVPDQGESQVLVPNVSEEPTGIATLGLNIASYGLKGIGTVAHLTNKAASVAGYVTYQTVSAPGRAAAKLCALPANVTSAVAGYTETVVDKCKQAVDDLKASPKKQ